MRRHQEDLDRRARTAQRDLAEVEASVTSRDGAITVTVNPAGALTGLVLGPCAAGLSRVQLAESVLDTARQARAAAAARAVEIVTPLLGPLGARFVREQFTPPDAEPDR